MAQEDPFGAGKKAPAAAAKVGRPPEQVQRDPLAIELLRASNPTTPHDLLQAAQSALQYGRADESKRYMAKLMGDKPADEALAPLTARYGDFLFQLSRTPEVQPEGKQLADLIYAAAQRIVASPERIEAAIAQLSDPVLGNRQEALGKLAEAGTHVVNPMLRVLADSTREKEHANIRAALVALAGSTELPLIGALDVNDELLKMQVIAVLGRMGSSRAVLPMMRLSLDPSLPAELRELAATAIKRTQGAAPDLYEAQRYLTRETAQLFRGELPYERNANDQVMLWTWDQAKQEVTPTTLPRGDAGTFLAARAARDLYLLKPGDYAAQRLMLLTNLELAKVIGGLDRPLSTQMGTVGATAAAIGPRVLGQVLVDAMQAGRVPAAIAAAEMIGHSGNASVLSTPGSVSPLAEALLFPDRRVRLAAALAIVKFAPGKMFPGAGRLSDTLGWFVGTSGISEVLVGHPRGEDAQSLVGFMNDLGFDGEGAYTGRALAERAFANPDYEFILIADAIDQPPVEELVQWLRRDFRTARQPIGVMARGDRLEKLQNSLASDPFTTVFPRIHSTGVAANEIGKLNSIAGRNLVQRDERLAQASAALAALTTLAKNQDNLSQYELLRHEPTIIRALHNPVLAVDAAKLLAQFGTPKSQTALVDFASQTSQPLTERQAAATAFSKAVKSRGLLLTQAQIAQQYDRHNAVAKTADQETLAVLGSILDTIEAPAIARGELKRGD
jgi:hypothetical protein